MKIALSNFVSCGGKTGIGSYVHGLLQGMDQVDKEHSIDVLMPEGEIATMRFSNPHIHLEGYSDALAHPLRNILWHHFSLPKILNEGNFDLIHIPTFRRIPLWINTPLVATIHDLALFRLPDKYDTARWFYHHYFLKRAIFNCSEIITVSKQTKSDLVELIGYPEDKITVIYPGVDHSLFQPIDMVRIKEELANKYSLHQPYILYVSRIEHPGKNHVALVRAFEKLKQQHSLPHELIFAGADWSGAETVHRAAKESSQSDSIRFLGFVPKEILPSLYSGASVVVMPSLWEGFGLPILEAMACGAKVCCSNIASLKEIGEGHATLFDPKDPDAIANTIAKAIESSSAETIRENLVYAQGFTWEACARQTLEVYTRAVRVRTGNS